MSKSKAMGARGVRLSPGKALLAAVVVAATIATALSVRAAAPACRYQIGIGTVIDTKTGLMWQRDVVMQFGTYGDALNECSSLNAAPALGGYADWRLPTKKELETLVDVRAFNPAIDLTAFPNTPAAWFFTSTDYPGGYKWCVSFIDGGSGAQGGSHAARCVRP